MIVRVVPEALPAAVTAALGGATVHIAYHLPATDRYIIRGALPNGQRQEMEYDVARGRWLTVDERRAELPPPRHDQLGDEGVGYTTSYRITDTTCDKLVNFKTDDGSVDTDQLVHTAAAPDGAQVVREELQRQRFPARYATWGRPEKVAHLAQVIHRWRRARGESGKDEDEIYTPQLVRDLERTEPNLRDMLAEILTQVGALEQTPAAEAIAAFTARTGIAVSP